MLLFAVCNNDVEFTRFVQGKTLNITRTDSSNYIETILVKHMPRNRLTRSKIMIAYFDSVGFSKDYLSSEMPEISYYTMDFYKSTRITRRYFIEFAKYWAGEQPFPEAIYRRGIYETETFLGGVALVRCKNDTATWRVRFSRGFKETFGFLMGHRLAIARTILLNECATYVPESERNLILIDYYMELQNKKNVVH